MRMLTAPRESDATTRLQMRGVILPRRCPSKWTINNEVEDNLDKTRPAKSGAATIQQALRQTPSHGCLAFLYHLARLMTIR